MFRLMIADDEDAERMGIKFLLNKFGYRFTIREASDGMEALRGLEDFPADILLTDVKMPFLDGIDLAAKVREKYPEIQIIFFSGYDDFEYVKQALSLQAVDYILKPVDPAEFQRVINSAMNFTADSDAILTLGMKPTRPETGYGYIEADLSVPSTANKEVFRVYSFKEKPDLETARRYIQKNNFFWNAGISVWNVNTVVNALRVYQPAISKVFERLLPYYYTDKEQEMIDRNFPLCENISVDYAIMEKADEIFVLPASFGWSDLGTWGSLHENLPKDAHNNTQIGENIKLYETRNCVIHTTQEKRVVVQGLDGYIVAEKNNTLLICRLSEEQRIKEFSAE